MKKLRYFCETALVAAAAWLLPRLPRAVILGLAETFVASVIDPGLTLAAAYLLFVLVLLFRPQGLFGRRPS